MSKELANLDEVSAKNVIVRKMLAQSLPFDRTTYISLYYEGVVPTPWTHAHEMRLPPVFRDANAEQVNKAIQGLGDAIGVTYTGDIPR